MLKYNCYYETYYDDENKRKNAPYVGLCKGGFVVMDILKSIPAGGLDLTAFEINPSVEEGVKILSEHFDLSKLVIYDAINENFNTVMPRAISDKFFRIPDGLGTSVLDKTLWKQDDSDSYVQISSGLRSQFIKVDGDKKESLNFENKYLPYVGTYTNNIDGKDYRGMARVKFLASDNIQDGEIPNDFNLYCVTIAQQTDSNRVPVKVFIEPIPENTNQGLYELLKTFKQGEPSLPNVIEYGTYASLNGIVYPLRTGEPDWGLYGEAPVMGLDSHSSQQGFFENERVKGSVLSCESKTLKFIKPELITVGYRQEDYKKLIENNITDFHNYDLETPIDLSYVKDTKIEIRQTTYKDDFSSRATFKTLTGGQAGIDAYLLSSNTYSYSKPNYVSFLVLDGLEQDGTFTEFSNVYIVKLYRRNDGEPLFQNNENDYGLVYYRGEVNQQYGYWRPQPELKQIFLGVKFNIVGTVTPPETDEDPFKPGDKDPNLPSGGDSSTGGGGGSHNSDSDIVDVPDFPSVDNQAINTGFTKAWSPSPSERDQFASYLFSSDIIDTIAKFFTNPMDVVLKASIMPLDPYKGTPSELTVAGKKTGISLTPITNQYREFDLGSCKIDFYWNSFLDFDPYTEIELSLPFVGDFKINTYDVMGKTLSVKYRLDYFNGDCLALIYADGQLTYIYNANVAYDVPIAANVNNGAINGLSSVVGGITGAIAGAATANPIMAVSSGVSALTGAASLFVKNIQHTNGIGGSVGYMSTNFAYVRIVRPVTAIPKNYGKLKGYTSNITQHLASVKGFTIIDSIHLDSLGCSDNELNELENILRSGVIF